MKTLVRILCFTTLAFALSTAYFARALNIQRTRTALIAASASPRANAGTGIPAPPRSSSGQNPAVATQLDPAASAAAARERLARYNDPAARAEIIARNRASRAESWKPIAASMQLQSFELDRLLDTLAEQAAESDQRRLECRIASCDSRALEASLKESYQESLARTLGPAGFEKWKAYVDAIPERLIVDELRRNLPTSSALSDVEAERLVVALADERHKAVERAAQLGRKVQVSGAGFTVQDFQGDAAPKPFGPSNKEMTKDFNSRLLSRATQNLSREQLAEFTKIQDERLKNAALMEALLSLSEQKSR